MSLTNYTNFVLGLFYRLSNFYKESIFVNLISNLENKVYFW